MPLFQGGALSLKEKPAVLGNYFKWHHTPSKGSSITLPGFAEEMSVWWADIQPEWRYKDEYTPDGRKDYSFILAGGKKGAFLLVLCLAWWDKEHGRGMKKERADRLDAAKAAGKGDEVLDFSDLPDHDIRWFNTLNDLIFVMECAQSCPVPGDATHVAAVGPVRKKRASGKGGRSSPRKKAKLS